MDFHWDNTCYLVTQELAKTVMLKHCFQTSLPAQKLSACDIIYREFAAYLAVLATCISNFFGKLFR